MINVAHLSSQMVTGTFTGTLLVVYISILPTESLTAQCFVTYFLMRRGEVRRREEQEERDGERMRTLCAVKEHCWLCTCVVASFNGSTQVYVTCSSMGGTLSMRLCIM